MQATMRITYWHEPSGWWIGYADEYPEYMTQGKTLDELKKSIRDLVEDIEDGDIPGVRKHAVLEMA